VAALNPDFFFAVGELMQKYALDEAVANEFPAERAFGADTAQDAAKMLLDVVKEGDSVLLKASRGMALEDILDAWQV
jgi:UDP-N-acetylmuramyl pentapeptide synthase